MVAMIHVNVIEDFLERDVDAKTLNSKGNIGSLSAPAITNITLSDDKGHSKDYFRRRFAARLKSNSALPPEANCSLDSECAGYPLAYCDRICRCIHGALNAGSSCISSVQFPGEPCQYSQQCAAAEAGAFCLRHRCECAYGMKASGNKCTFVGEECHERGFIFIPEIGECREVLSPGRRGCSHNLQCSIAFPDAKCILHTCTCPSNLSDPIDGTCGKRCRVGQIYSGVTGQCLPSVEPGEQCFYTSQCHAVQQGMICDRNVCRCPNDMVFSGSICTQFCTNGYMVNSKGICILGCQNNQVEVDGTCLNQAVPGQACRVNAQCIGGSTCQNEQCICPKAMEPRGSTCAIVEASPLASCHDGELCIKNSVCINGTCDCPNGLQIVNGQCMIPLTVSPNSVCNSFDNCGGNSSCINGTCQCPANQQAVNGFCRFPNLVTPGKPCRMGFERCIGQAICINGVCQCPFGMLPSEDHCVALLTVPAGSVCGPSVRCKGNIENVPYYLIAISASSRIYQ
ncbi:EGF-like domain protein [Dictyocaulus viviparus]|uniref:EGF-like domain protein n=1 Tax=Dictyocaulus viviparus TaxID=29172 RepID=A0A0D8XI19_DICVI|nr:EGF-like domain protein [Dictyocaulus viviparus]